VGEGGGEREESACLLNYHKTTIYDVKYLLLAAESHSRFVFIRQRLTNSEFILELKF